MKNLVRRLRKLEQQTPTDATGLVPHSQAWFAYYEDQFAQWKFGQEFPYIPLAAIDHMLEEADRAELAQNERRQLGQEGNIDSES